MQQFLAIAFVLGVLWAVVWLLGKKTGAATVLGPLRPGSKPRRIEHVDRIRLTPQHSIHIVHIDGQRIVIGVHPHGFAVLSPAGGGVLHDRQETS